MATSNASSICELHRSDRRLTSSVEVHDSNKLSKSMKHTKHLQMLGLNEDNN
jgi:hypothetical protein